MVDLLLNTMIIIFIFQFTCSLYFVIKIFLLYKDITSGQLALVVLINNITILTSLLYYNADMINNDTATLSFKLALFTVLLIVIMISVFLDKALYSVKTRALSKISFFLLSIVLGIILSEFITGENNFFYLDNVEGQRIPHYELAPSLLIVIGGVLILTAVFLSYRDITSISESLVSKKSFYLILISSTTIFTAFLINLVIQTLSVNTLVQTGLLNKDTIYLLHFSSLNLLSFSFAYFSYSQPFLNLTGGLRPNLLVQKGLLGYYLAYHTDKGPEPLSYSGEFVKSANMQDETLLALAVSSIILVGMFREEDSSFVSKVSLIPIPGVEAYSAIVYSFVTKSKTIEDNRFKEKTPAVFAILFPSNLSIAVRNMNQTLKDVLDYSYKYPTIDELNQEQILLSLTYTILRKILL